ncbi:MAG: HigA family addiction module antidote protein [Nitriliruptorales bacterium]|nr:HigA family addiction module antidote protein [Nitriliruptorales bacterium]
MTTPTIIAPVHPGEILADDLDELQISQSQLARALGVPRSRINQIVLGHRSIEADTALRLARFFGTSDRYWLNLQARYHLEVTKDALGDALAKVQPLNTAS